jgi:hypothetical protein
MWSNEMNTTKLIPAPQVRDGLFDLGAQSWGMVQSGPMSGPGVGLQLPQNFYPTELYNAPYDFASNYIGLAAGDQVPIPHGDWLIGLGSYCVLQFQDPVNAPGVWSIVATAAWDSGLIYLQSDGFSYRIANMTGCPVGGIVNNYGAGGYVQATTSIAVTGGGGSTWAPVVGGQLVMTTATIVTANAGAGYGVAPIAFIPAPPGPSNNANGVGGVQATGYCTIASGTVSGFTFTNPGAGYTATTYTVICYPNPTDPNIPTGITLATLTFSLTGSGSITGLFCTNPGAPLSTPNNITLTVSGAGTQGTVSPIMMQTVVGTSVIGGSTLASGSVSALLTSVGGYPQSAGPATPITGTITNAPVYLVAGSVSAGATNYGLWARPRPLQAVLAIGATGTLAAQTGIIYDGGLFYGVPTPIFAAGGGNLLAATGTVIGTSTITLTMGPRPDFVVMQPLKV